MKTSKFFLTTLFAAAAMTAPAFAAETALLPELSAATLTQITSKPDGWNTGIGNADISAAVVAEDLSSSTVLASHGWHWGNSQLKNENSGDVSNVSGTGFTFLGRKAYNGEFVAATVDLNELLGDSAKLTGINISFSATSQSDAYFSVYSWNGSSATELYKSLIGTGVDFSADGLELSGTDKLFVVWNDGVSAGASNVISNLTSSYTKEGFLRQTLTWNGGDNGVWKAGSSGWKSDSGDADFQNGDYVTFGAGTDNSATLEGVLKTRSLTISADTTFAVAADKTSKLTTEALELNADLTIGSGVTLALTGTSGTLNKVDDFSKIKGTGTFAFSAANSGNGSGVNLSNFNGEFYLTGGLLRLADTSAVVTTLGADASLRVASGAALVFNESGTNFEHDVTFEGDSKIHTNSTYSGSLSGKIVATGGALIKEAGGTLTIGGEGSLVTDFRIARGSVVFNGGEFTIKDGNSISGNLTLQNGTTLNIRKTDSLSYSATNTITIERGSRLDFGTNRWTVGANNSLVLKGGTISGVGDGTGALDYYRSSTLSATEGDSAVSANVRIRNEGVEDSGTLTLDVAQRASLLLSGTIMDSNGGVLVKRGAGTLTLTGANTWTGGTTLAAGTLVLGSSSAIGTGALNITGSSTLQLGEEENSDAVRISNSVSVTGDTLNLVAANGADNALSGGIEALSSTVAISGGKLSLSGANSVKSLSVSGANLSVAGTFSVSEGVSQTGGNVAFSTALDATKLSVADGGAFSNSAATTLSDSLTVSGENTSASFTGTLSVPKISVSGNATLSISSLQQRPSYTIAVADGSLVIGDNAATNLSSQFTVSLEGGSISGLELMKAAGGSSLALRSGTIENLNLGAADSNSGVSLVLYATQAGDETLPGGAYLNSEAAITLSGSFALASATKLDISNLVFDDAGQRYALFNVANGLSSDDIVSALNLARGDIAGHFGYDADNGFVYFEADEGMQFAIAWDATLNNINWREDAIQGVSYDNLANRSVLFGKIASADDAEVRISRGAVAKLLTVRAGTKQTYVVGSESEDPDFRLERLRVERGTLDLRTKTKVGAVEVAGGTLLASTTGALTLSDDGDKVVKVSAGTLTLNATDATNAKGIELSGGASLQFVNGAFSALENLSVTGTSTSERAEIKWLGGATDSLAGKLSGATPYVDFVVESGEVAWGSSGGNELHGDFVKKGAGTFYVDTTGALGGVFRVEEGALKLGQTIASAGAKRIFNGDIAVSGSNASLYLHAANALGASDAYGQMTISLSDGASLYLRGGINDDTQTLNNVNLVLGVGTKVASAPRELSGSSASNVLGIKLGTGSSVSMEDEGASALEDETQRTAEISVLVQLARPDVNFFVAEDLTLILSRGVADNLSDASVAGGLVKTGAGTLTLSGSLPSGRGLKVYSGTTKIEEGALVLDGKPDVGTGEVAISAGASLVVRASETTEISGGVSGFGAVVAETGSAVFSANVAAASASVASDATMLLANNSTFELKNEDDSSGTLALNGTFGGHGSFKGDVVFGEGATLYAGTHVSGTWTDTDVLTFDASVADTSLKALRKTGSGEARLGGNTSLDGFTLTLEGGRLSAGKDQSVSELVFNGGGISSQANASWTTDKITVDTEGGVIDATLELAAPAQQTSLVLGGELEIGTTGSLSVDGTLNLSAKNGGSLVIGTSGGNGQILAGGGLRAKTLNVDASVKSIAMGAEVRSENNRSFRSEIVADEINFAGATKIDGKGGIIVVGDRISFASGASVNFAGTLSTLAYGYADYEDAVNAGADLSATANVASGASVRIGELIGGIEKVGAGTLVVAQAQMSQIRNIKVSEGTLRFDSFDSSLSEAATVAVSGSAILDISSLILSSSGASISLTDGATFKGNLDFSGTRDAASELRNSKITGGLSIKTAGSDSNGLTVENLAVSGTLTFGRESVDNNDSKMTGTLVLNGASPAITANNLEVYTNTDASFGEALSWDNFSVDFASIGSEFVIVQTNRGVEVYQGVKSYDGFDYSAEKTGDYVIFGQKSGVQGRDYDLVWDDKTNSLKIIAYGTMQWNGATTWDVTGTDSGWQRTARDGISLDETFRENDYAEFSFTGIRTNGKDNKINVAGAVKVGGVVFKGADANASFTVNFTDGSSIADYVADDGSERGSSVSVLSGTVVFKGADKISGDNMYSGGLTIASGAGVRTDGAKALGTGAITLGGTLAFGRRDGDVSSEIYAIELNSDIETAGTGATLTADSGVNVTLRGAVTGTALKKAGAGTLTLAGNAKLDKLTVSEGSVAVNTSGVCGVGFFAVLDGASSSALTFAAGTQLDAKSGLSVAGGKTVRFNGAETALNYVEFGGDKSVVRIADNGRFVVGGIVSETLADGNAEDRLVTAEISKTGLSGTGASEIVGNLALKGGALGDSVARLVVNVEDEIATVKISGNIVDAGDSDDGKFILSKVGAGVFAVAGDMNTAAGLSLSGGSVKIGGAAELSGDVYVGANSTLEILGGGTIGSPSGADAEASNIVVASGTTLMLKTGENAVEIKGNLTVAGTLEVSGGVVVGGADNLYEELIIGKGATLTVDAAAKSFSGNSLTLNAGSKLVVKADLDASSGTLTYNASGSSIELGGKISFSQIGGSNATTLTLTGAGEVCLTGVGVTLSTKTLSLASGDVVLAFESDSDQKTGLFSGSGTLVKRGTGTLYVDTLSDQNFTGKTQVEAGTLRFGVKGGDGKGSLGQSAISVAENAEVVAVRTGAKVGSTVAVTQKNGYVAKSVSGAGSIIAENTGSIVFTDAEALENFTGTLGARAGGTLYYNGFAEASSRGLILENGGTLEVLAASGDDAAGELHAGTMALSGSGNRIVTLERRTLTIGDKIVLSGGKGAADLTVAGSGDLSIANIVKASADSKVNFDIYTDADFAGTLRLSGENSAHRNTYVNAGTVEIADYASAAGSGTIRLAGEKSTLRFTNLDEQEITTSIVGAGRIEGDSGVLSGLNEDFSGKIVAVKGENSSTLTVDKSGEETLSLSRVEFSAESGAELVIDLTGASLDEVSEVDMGAATFTGNSGVIGLKLGAGRALEIDASNAGFAGTLRIDSGTVKVLDGGDLGTADVTIGADALLNVASEIFTNDIAGAGTLVKNSAGTTFVSGAISAKTLVQRGTLAVAKLGDVSTDDLDDAPIVEISGGTLEFSKKISGISGAVIDREAGSVETFEGKFVASGAVARFSHDGVYASSVVNGEFSWKDGVAGTLMLVGGGEGSVFNPQIAQGDVVKSGSGKWTLADTAFDATSGNKISVEANGGTLALETYQGFSEQILSVGAEGVLEIAGFGSSDHTIRGKLTGEGTLAISAGGVTELDFEADSSWAGALQVRSGATVKSDGSELRSKTIELIASSNASTKGGVLDLALAGDTTLSGVKISVYGTSKDAGDLNNGCLKVSGGMLDLRGSTLRLGGVLDVKDLSTVKIATIESVSPTSGVVNLAGTASLEIGAAGTTGNLVSIAGAGTVRFVEGTTYLKNVNAAQMPEDFNADFEGRIEIFSNATAVLGTDAGFGNAQRVSVEGTLRIEQGNAGTLNALSGSGTLEIANKSATVRTTYVDGDFDGMINVGTGRLVMTPATFDTASVSEIRLSGGANAGLVLSNVEPRTELSVLNEKNVTGTGTVYLENGEFTLAKDGAFGYAKTLDVTAGTTLALGSGSTVASGLHVAKGATLDLTRSLAAIPAMRFAVANDSVAPAQATRTVQGDFRLDGTLLANVPAAGDSAVHATGNAVVGSTAEVTIFGDIASAGTVAVVSGDGSVSYVRGASFRDESGATLAYGIENGVLVVSESVPETAIVADGLEAIWATIATRPNSLIWDAVKSLPTNAAQTAALRNFSPVSFAGILDLSSGLVQLENDLLRQRLEQRRYDRAFNESAGTLKPFANAIGSVSDTSEGKNKRPNYDLSHSGAVVGFDTLVTEDFLLGASFTCDKGKAKVHNGGGKHETDAARLNFYGMAMLDEVSYFGFGAGVGIVSADTKRNNALESLTGETSGTDVSLTATLGRAFVLSSELGVHVSPYVGLDYTYSSFDAFTESGGSQSALDVDKAERNSLRASVGATLNWVPSEAWRLSLEAAYHHEFLDTDSDVDAKFVSGEYRGMNASATSYFGGENSLSIGPRVEYRINAEWSVSAGYTFETDFEDTTTHSANVGVRCRF